jgi:quercetin dioxygenase-like cupin family protein
MAGNSGPASLPGMTGSARVRTTPTLGGPHAIEEVSTNMTQRDAKPVTATPGAQQPGITRTDLQRHDLSVPGREVIQTRVDFPAGVVAPRHSHPGEEIVYAIAGVLEYRLEGKPPVTLEAGEVLFIPAETIHAVKNVGSGNAAELATYVVEIGKPLVVLAE